MINGHRLEVRKLGKKFTLHSRGGIQVEGFSDINFTLDNGQLLALSGPSGAGKSSILKTIFGPISQTAGKFCFAEVMTAWMTRPQVLKAKF